MPTIHDLPPEMLCVVFEHLGPGDLFEKKSVCKLWNELISKVKIERLSLDADMVVKELWHHTNRPCRESELCHPNLFVVHHKKPVFLNLKYLKLCYRVWNKKLRDFNLNELNTFSQLLQLELDYYRDESLYLSLPNLQVLSLNWPTTYCRTEVNCPKLRVFQNRENAESSMLRVHHPDIIRVLGTATAARLAQFENLECLKYRHYDVRFFAKSILMDLKKLKEIYYDFSLECFNDRQADGEEEQDDYHEAIQALQELMRQKSFLRSNLQVYFCGLRLVKEDLSDIDFMVKIRNGKTFLSNEPVYIRHYDRLQAKMEFVREVNYSVLLKTVNVLPVDYFSRFCHLCRVTATCPLDEQHFLKFLKKIFRLDWLQIYDTNLSQGFFDSLAEFNLLNRFCLSKSHREAAVEDREVQLNFDFISHFDQLAVIQIDYSLSPTSLRTFIASFRNLRRAFFNEWPFKFKGKCFKVKRNGQYYDELVLLQSYDLVASGNRTLLERVGLDEVADYFERTEV